MMYFEIRVQASVEDIWKEYLKVESWPEWDKALERAELTGDFMVGNKGRIKSKGMPELTFELVEVEPGKVFSNQSLLPNGDKLQFIHSLEEEKGKTKMIHGVRIIKNSGEVLKKEVPLLMNIFSAIPDSMFNLKEIVERK